MTASTETSTTTERPTATSKGLTLSVYSNPSYRRCSAGGLSERVDQVTLVGVIDETDGGIAATGVGVKPVPKSCQVFAAREDRPAVVLVKRRFGSRSVWHVQPLPGEEGEYAWYMAGGSYVGTTDSRMSEDLGIGFYGALSFHDRNER